MQQEELDRYNKLAKEDEACKLANHSMGVDTLIEFWELQEKFKKYLKKESK